MLTEIHFRAACGFNNGGGTDAVESEEEGRPQVCVGRGNSGQSHRDPEEGERDCPHRLAWIIAHTPSTTQVH